MRGTPTTTRRGLLRKHGGTWQLRGRHMRIPSRPCRPAPAAARSSDRHLQVRGGERERERGRQINDFLLYRLHVISQVPFTYMTTPDSKQVISLLHLFPRHPTPHTTHPLPLHTRVTGELAHTKSLYQDALGRHERDHAAIDRLEREATEGEAARGKIKEVQ